MSFDASNLGLLRLRISNEGNQVHEQVLIPQILSFEVATVCFTYAYYLPAYMKQSQLQSAVYPGPDYYFPYKCLWEYETVVGTADKRACAMVALLTSQKVVLKRDGSGSGSGRISVDFGFAGFGFGF